MGAFWVVAEARNLIDGEGDVRACVIGDVGENADDLAVMPFSFPLETVVVVIQNSSSWGGNGIGGGKTSEWEDFVDEVCLCEGDVSLWSRSEIYSEKGVDVGFFCE